MNKTDVWDKDVRDIQVEAGTKHDSERLLRERKTTGSTIQPSLADGLGHPWKSFGLPVCYQPKADPNPSAGRQMSMVADDCTVSYT